MEREGFVSLWVGLVNSMEEMDKLLESSYTEDGELIPSIFARGFEIERYDDAVREAELYDEPNNSLGRLLEGFSYDDIILPKFIKIHNERLFKSFNTVILLYNFEYKGNKQELSIESSQLEFLGAVEYQ